MTRLLYNYFVLQDICEISYDIGFCLLFNFCLKLSKYFHMLKLNHSDHLAKQGF